MCLSDQPLSVELDSLWVFAVVFVCWCCLYFIYSSLEYRVANLVRSTSPMSAGGTEWCTNVATCVVCLQWNFSHTQLRHKSLEKLLHYWTGENRHIFSQVNYTNLIHHKKVFLFSFVFLILDFKRTNHWHCPRNLTSWRPPKLNKKKFWKIL